MNGYVSRAACRGRRPSQFAAFSGKERPTLMAALLKDRSVARFIVAPDGYGKTSLAIEYAETMFSWRHTFWFNARSPCFIRDIDDGGLVDTCLVCDDAAELVVFDDVPPLDSERAERFSQEIDGFLEQGCEIIVLCPPLSDMFGRYQVDRLRLGARDLLLDDEELDALRDADQKRRVPAQDVGCLERIAQLAWNRSDASEEQFAKAALGEDMPSDMAMVLANALVLGAGPIEDALPPGRRIGLDRLSEMFADYPHIEFDRDARRFETPYLALASLAAPLKKHAQQLAEQASCESLAQLACTWADSLIERNQPERACDVMRALCSQRLWAAWLARNARTLVGGACFLSTVNLVADVDAGDAATRANLLALEALCLRVLGDERTALSRATRVAFDEAAPLEARLCGQLLVAQGGSKQSAAHAHRRLADYRAFDFADAESADALWPLLARAWCASQQGAAELAALWVTYQEQGVCADALNVCASWLFSLVGAETDEEELPVSDLASCERFVREQLSSTAGSALDYLAASAGLALEQAHSRGYVFADGPLGTASLMQLHHAETDIYQQRQRYEQQKRARTQKAADWSITHPDTVIWQTGTKGAPKRTTQIPVLELRVFGRFDAAIGGVPIDKSELNKRQVRTLLVLLATSRGRELSREVIIEALWPESADEAQKSNFYTAWSRLRRVLTLPDGTCPYLVRHKYGCSLEPRYIQSDVDRFDEICRDLLFGVPDYERWSMLFAEIEHDFSGELLPAERKNVRIMQMRNEYRNRLVDALVAAAESIALTDTPKWGVWFARSALRHDDTREDAYVALMRAQVAGNQRTAAMMTYLKCRRVLSDKLGIDPSPEASLIYEELLGDG